MDKIVKKIFILTLIGFLVSTLFLPVFSQIDYSQEEDKWDRICSVRESYVDNKASCDAYEQYLKDKKAEMDKNLSNIKNDISSISGDIRADEKLLTEATIAIEALNEEIAGYKNEVVILERQIGALEEKIEARQIVIDEKLETAQNYMVNIQSTTRINVYVDFIFGASNFSDISRRVEGMNLINGKNKDNIRALNEEKAKLEEDKLDIDFQRKSVISLMERQEERVAYQEQLKAYAQERVIVLRREYNELLAAQAAAEEERKLAVSRIESIGPIETSYGGLGFPVSSGYYVSGRPWAYAGGGKHLGLDLASGVGTPLYAPANGIVIATNNGCPTYGSLSSTCGGSYGNYVLMIVSADDRTYGVIYAHLQNGGVSVARGQSISKGQRVGLMGSSGSSTGPHVHVEIFYLGSISIQEAYDNWYNGPQNIQFGLGGSSSSNEYGNRCEIKGMVPNCRINPASYWGV